MKKICIALISMLVLLTGCSKDNGKLISTDIFSDTEAAETLDGRWLFLPEKAIVIRTVATDEKLQADFKGCEYAEINEYAKQIFDTLISKGCTIHDAKTLDYTKLMEFKAAELDLNFAGTAYAYYYTLNSAVYFIEISYYGCGGGTYGNGKASVSITNVTDVLGFLLEE